MEPVVIGRSRTKTVAISVGGVALVAASVLMAVMTGDLVLQVVGTFGAVFFGASLLWIWASYARGGPGLVIDDAGFDDRNSAVAVGRVPWADVLGLGTWDHQGRSFVVVGVRNPEHYLARLGWFARSAARMNVGLVGSPITVSATGLSMSAEDVLAEMVERFEASGHSGSLGVEPPSR